MRTLRVCLLAFLVVVWGVGSLAVGSAHARDILDPSDPALAGSVIVALPPTPIPPGTTSFQFVSNGVTFQFQSLDRASSLGGSSAVPVLPRFQFGFLGVLLTITPPVAAIGFFGEEIDGTPAGTFTGTLANEDVRGLRVPGPLVPIFFGAADIGDISSIVFPTRGSSAAFVLTEMRFVPSGAPPPGNLADLAMSKAVNGPPLATGASRTLYSIDVLNQGPDIAVGAQVLDFLPPEASFIGSNPAATLSTAGVATIPLGDLPAPSATPVAVEIQLPEFGQGLFCESVITNISVVTAQSLDPQASDNFDVAVQPFDQSSRAGEPEVCDNAIDDNCDGRADCRDSGCRFTARCRPPRTSESLQCDGTPLSTLAVIPDLGRLFDGVGCDAPDVPDVPPHDCRVPRGRCGGAVVPAACCDPGFWSNPANNLIAAESCNVGIPGCVPVDPNRKESEPAVGAGGLGVTEAGATLTYTLRYENIGTADAHDVSIIDVLHPALDDTTLAVNNGGSYDPATRTLRWRDPVVPPATPRAVSFSVAVAGDAPPLTRIRNVGTIVFPDAVPPSRIDTNVVEHIVKDPGLLIAPDLKVVRCQETAPGAGLWRVGLANRGFGFAYNVRATILAPPASVQVTDGVASFAHPTDPAPLATVVPLAVTPSANTVRFATQTAGDPCEALVWRVQWEDAFGAAFARDVQASPDADGDAVADHRDNCPRIFNPDQADADGNGVGDACGQQLVCDVDGNGQVDRDDIDAIFAARNTVAGRGDSRDASSPLGDGLPDGVITVEDSRFCTLRCTKPRCAP
jgi:uncharacterized repeat protein (TIGR01451 family)